jgi:2-polyprenyl-3-methyl-5-hydroxy-6-metoxy-1,4-benzoquinol methylase
MQVSINSGSFRDPSGFIFERNGIIFRQVNSVYAQEFDTLLESGLMQLLQSKGDLICHDDVDIENAVNADAYRIIKPTKIPFISYPYEWSFSQLKDAALLTLDIQQMAIAHGMSLKDASAYNVQFMNGRSCFIDTLSFERYKEGEPWAAYGQFCQHFLAPLALMSFRDVRLNQLLRIHLNGIPLDLAVRLLPFLTTFRVGLFIHLFLHAKTQKKYSASKANKHNAVSHPSRISRQGLTGIIGSLKQTIKSLCWKPAGTPWADYYHDTNYTDMAFTHKKNVVANFVRSLNPQTIWDIGANDGTFSKIACEKGARVIAFDSDAAAVEKNYLRCKSEGETRILPLVLDLTNPSPAIGWGNKERQDLIQRGPADMIMALALIHHLCIGNNLPFTLVAEFLSLVCKSLIIEFVLKSDSQVQRLLQTKKDVFQNYNETEFVNSFEKYFTIVSRNPIEKSNRIVFLMKSN